MQHPQTEPAKRAAAIDWYRTPVDPAALKKLYARSDAQGCAQTLGYLAVLVVTGSTAFYSAAHWPWWATLMAVFLHGTCFAFQINAVHELGHGTVFRSKRLNIFFTHLYAFLGWINHRMFETSHVRHHRSTLHPPDDLEVVAPIKITLKDFLRSAIVNIDALLHVLRFTVRIARGRFEGEWELTLFPESRPEKRRWASEWAWILLAGHAALICVALCLKLWMIPILVTFAPFYGGWLFFLCNNTQHVGLRDNTSDFRACCRTFLPNPIVRFLYWRMNYHTEHHMYVGVPCYHLGKLHALIEHDLPPSPMGIAATWREIGAILRQQAENPSYEHPIPLPASRR